MLKLHKFKKLGLHSIYYSLFFSLIFLTGVCFWLFYESNKLKNVVMPGIYVNDQVVSNVSRDQLDAYLNSLQARLQDKNLNVFIDGKIEATIPAKLLNLTIPTKIISDQIMNYGNTEPFLTKIQILANTLLFDKKKIFEITPTYNLEYLDSQITTLSNNYFLAPIDAKFQMSGNKVVDFAFETNGRELNITDTKKIIKEQLKLFLSPKNPLTTIDLNLKTNILKPKFFLSDQNSLGIVEKIGEGFSNYHHSSPERIHNLTHGSNVIHGTLIAPGTIFSFNEALGDISKATGYKEAYIISQGRTQLGDGGGICQTSSTFFRAVLNAGLPIIERKAHAYRVRYYENDSDPGFDATVYSPSPDLKIKNDTPSYILLWINNDKENLKLTYTLYGKKDGRVATISNYKKWGASSAPPAIYQDDPSLRRGVTKQVDFAVSGLNTSFDYSVTRNNQSVFQKTFVSNFRPWPAVFLVGTRD